VEQEGRLYPYTLDLKWPVHKKVNKSVPFPWCDGPSNESPQQYKELFQLDQDVFHPDYVANDLRFGVLEEH